MSLSTSIEGGIKHGFTGAMYCPHGEREVRVVMPDGRVGLFDNKGRWIEGELYEADAEMCVWVGADRIAASHRLSNQTTATSKD